MSNGDSSGNGYDSQSRVDPYGSLRQSPPPKTNMLIPTGATISPPESSHNSSDDEEPNNGRGRNLENLAELQAAISILQQRKESSPNRGDEENTRARLALDLVVPQLDKLLSTPNNTSAESSRSPLSREARKISHSRSSTDSNIVLDLGRQRQSPTQFGPADDGTEEEDSDESVRSNKPPMLRKKSGELVRPALRPSSGKQRPSSVPGTPTYSKAVHFDSHLEHVRHFLQVDKPLAVSASTSPVENYEGEVEFPFSYDESGGPRQQPFEWEIRLSNFPTDTPARQSLPVRVERVFLSSDNKNLVGVVVVQNLAFQKLVVVRFTLDYWKTTSEVIADYNHDVRRRQNDGCDRFNFSIKLVDLANLENKTMFFCIRYSVNGQDYWDNNTGMNYQVDFTKKAKMPGIGARPLNALPRSKPPPLMSAGTRPKSLPDSFDDFAAGFDSYSSFSRSSPASIMGDSPIKLKSPRPRAEIVPDAPTRRTKAKAQAFGNRYDFGASLNAAIQNASAVLGDQSGLKPRLDTKQSFSQVPVSGSGRAPAPASRVTQTAKGTPASTQSPRPVDLLSGKPSLSSQLYQELVDKYCFVGTRK
jgi:Carbohydrate/starch-binding module (family 21)